MHTIRSVVSLLILACVATAVPYAFEDNINTNVCACRALMILSLVYSLSILSVHQARGIVRRNVPPAGSDLFNPGTLSHPWTPVTNIVEELVKDETGKKSSSGAETQTTS